MSKRFARGRTRAICSARSPTRSRSTNPGEKLFVCNGTQNAVAVFQFKPGESKLLGLIPAGWFPGAIAFDARQGKVYVANIKSIGAKMEKPRTGFGHGPGFNTKQYAGSLSLVPVPSAKELAALTQTALANLRYPLLAQAKLPPRENRPAQPVPERVGEPSVFQHVIYIIKENRSYDQVLGDVKDGQRQSRICAFSASASRPISTSSSAISCCWTTPIAAAS